MHLAFSIAFRAHRWTAVATAQLYQTGAYALNRINMCVRCAVYTVYAHSAFTWHRTWRTQSHTSSYCRAWQRETFIKRFFFSFSSLFECFSLTNFSQ